MSVLTTLAGGTAHHCCVRADGTLWCWGGSGRDPDNPCSEQPAQIGSGGGWTQISTGFGHSCGVRADGELWCWGTNRHGEAWREMRKRGLAGDGGPIRIDSLRASRAAADATRRSLDEIGESGTPEPVAQALQSFRLALDMAMHSLQQLDSLRALNNAVADAQDHYMPGGPPMSPVLDSTFSAWMLFDLRRGRARESISDIIVSFVRRMGPAGPLAHATHPLIERLGQFTASHNAVYACTRVVSATPCELRDVLTGEDLRVIHDSGLKIKLGDQVLWRLLAPEQPGEPWVGVLSAYLIVGVHARDWRDYVERVSGQVDSPSSARRNVFSGAGDERRWLEYIMDGYVGLDPLGRVTLTGVPDRPQTLPHSLETEDPEHGATQSGPAVEQHDCAAQKARTRLIEWIEANSRGRLREDVEVILGWLPAQMRGSGGPDLLDFAQSLAAFSPGEHGPSLADLALEVSSKPLARDLRECLDGYGHSCVSIYEIEAATSGCRRLKDCFTTEVVELPHSPWVGGAPKGFTVARMVGRPGHRQLESWCPIMLSGPSRGWLIAQIALQVPESVRPGFSTNQQNAVARGLTRAFFGCLAIAAGHVDPAVSEATTVGDVWFSEELRIPTATRRGILDAVRDSERTVCVPGTGSSKRGSPSFAWSDPNGRVLGWIQVRRSFVEVCSLERDDLAVIKDWMCRLCAVQMRTEKRKIVRSASPGTTRALVQTQGPWALS